MRITVHLTRPKWASRHDRRPCAFRHREPAYCECVAQRKPFMIGDSVSVSDTLLSGGQGSTRAAVRFYSWAYCHPPRLQDRLEGYMALRPHGERSTCVPSRVRSRSDSREQRAYYGY